MSEVSPQVQLSSPRRRGPIPRDFSWGTWGETGRHNRSLWLWVPAFAGTTSGESVPSSPSPSLPRRDDLDLVAGLEVGLGPAALRHDVVVQRDREMGALIVELAEQRVHAGRIHLALLAVDDHAHCITSLSIWPRWTYCSVSSASAGAIRKPWR